MSKHLETVTNLLVFLFNCNFKILLDSLKHFDFTDLQVPVEYGSMQTSLNSSISQHYDCSTGCWERFGARARYLTKVSAVRIWSLNSVSDQTQIILLMFSSTQRRKNKISFSRSLAIKPSLLGSSKFQWLYWTTCTSEAFSLLRGSDAAFPDLHVLPPLAGTGLQLPALWLALKFSILSLQGV